MRAQQTQAAIVRSSVKPSLKAACGLRHLGPSAPRLFTENLLCARHRTGASPWTGRQVIPPPGLVSSRTYLKGLLHRTQDTTGAPQRTDHALSHQPGSDLGPSGWPFRSWSLIRCWHSGVLNQHRSHSTQEPPPTTEEKDKSIKRPRSPLKTRSRGSATGRAPSCASAPEPSRSHHYTRVAAQGTCWVITFSPPVPAVSRQTARPRHFPGRARRPRRSGAPPPGVRVRSRGEQGARPPPRVRSGEGRGHQQKNGNFGRGRPAARRAGAHAGAARSRR